MTDVSAIVFLVFLAFGMVIGVVAAERRKRSVGWSLLAGAFLGVFSPLLFLMAERPAHQISGAIAQLSEEHVIRNMVLQIALGTIVITMAVLLLLNLFVVRV